MSSHPFIFLGNEVWSEARPRLGGETFQLSLSVEGGATEAQ